MDRKEFLGTLVALPVGLFLVSCSSDKMGSDSPAAPPTRSGTQTVYTSSDSGTPLHHHTFGIDDASFSAPPSAGLTGDTSNESSHTHSVVVSMAQLGQIATGQTVTVTTDIVQGHAHIFSFVKIA
ncbi:MAG TPA: hypothetical protein VGM29_09945 [Polyangiaceae bacterium]|jgi:hypothetical protein